MANFLPNALIDRMKRLEADKTAALVSMESVPIARQAILFNANKSSEANLLSGSQVPWWPDAHYLIEPNYSFVEDPYHYAGVYSRQDVGDLFIAYAMDRFKLNKRALRGLEIGTVTERSTLLMSSLLAPNSLWLVYPNNEQCYVKTKKEVAAWANHNTWIIPTSAKSLLYPGIYYDVIHYHAPFVSIRAFLETTKEIDQWTKDYLQLMEKKQLEDLKAALKLLKAQGYLFYISRSDLHLQDHNFVDRLMQEEGLKSVRLPLGSSWKIEERKLPVSGCYSYRFPNDAANEDVASLTVFYKEGFAVTENDLFEDEEPDRFEKDSIVRKWFAAPTKFCFKRIENELYMFPKALLPDYIKLSNVFDKRNLGLCIADWSKNTWIPRRELAWSTDLATNVPCIELEASEALAFIRSDEGIYSSSEDPKDFYLLKYKGIGLGWK